MGLVVLVILGTIFAVIYLFYYKRSVTIVKKIVDFVRYKIFFNTILRTSL